MAFTTISMFSWNRFRSRYLYVAPEVVGKRHRFPFEGQMVAISLPAMKMLTSRQDWMTQADHEILLSYNAWKNENGREQPVAYWVHFVDITIDFAKPVKVPSGILTQSPNAYGLVSRKRQDQLNKIADDQEETAQRAFDYWLKVMRWKTDNSAIGRPEVKGHESGWSTYLVSSRPRKRFWIGQTILHVSSGKPVSLRQWNQVGRLLREGIHSPLYFDYYFDALEHLALGDLDRCIVDLAVSCEASMRAAVANSLPVHLATSISRYVDRANIINYYDSFVPSLLPLSKRQKFQAIRKDIKDLFNERNSIVHGKGKTSSKLGDCQRFASATQCLISVLSK